MSETVENKDTAIRYLFDELSETERDKFEELLFSDENFSLFVENVENDLIDEYIRGELEFDEKRKFEKKYLTSESRHERVAIARTLNGKVFENKATVVVSDGEQRGFGAFIADIFRRPNPAMAGGFAAVILLLLIGGIWFINQPDKTPELANTDNSNQEDLPPEKPKSVESPDSNQRDNATNDAADKSAETNVQTGTKQEEKKKVKPQSKPKSVPEKPEKRETVVKKPSVFIATLLPPLRSSSNPILKIPPTAKTVRLQMLDNFGQKYEKFIVELNNSSGTTIWNEEINASAKRPQKSVTVSISGNKLQTGLYEIAVKGITKEGSVEDINFYNFTVQKKEKNDQK